MVASEPLDIPLVLCWYCQIRTKNFTQWQLRIFCCCLSLR